jgi:hypothetical protein
MILQYLSLIELRNIDLAIVNYNFRSHYLSVVNRMVIPSFDNFCSFYWIMARNILSQAIDFNNEENEPQHALALILNSRAHLQTLSLTGVNDVFFHGLGTFPVLTTLKVSLRYDWEGKDMIQFWTLNPQLNFIDLSYSYIESIGELIPCLISKCPSLRHLSFMFDDAWFDDDCVVELTQGSLDLLSLDISGTSVRLDQSIKRILKSFPNLQKIVPNHLVSNEMQELCLRQVAFTALLSNDPKIQDSGFDSLYDYFTGKSKDFKMEDATFSSILSILFPLLQHPTRVGSPNSSPPSHLSIGCQLFGI